MWKTRLHIRLHSFAGLGPCGKSTAASRLFVAPARYQGFIRCTFASLRAPGARSGTEIVVMESAITWTKRDGQHHGFLGGVANTLDCQTHIILLAAGSLCANILITITERISQSQNGHHIHRMDTIDGYMGAFPVILPLLSFSPHLSAFTTAVIDRASNHFPFLRACPVTISTSISSMLMRVPEPWLTSRSLVMAKLHSFHRVESYEKMKSDVKYDPFRLHSLTHFS